MSKDRLVTASQTPGRNHGRSYDEEVDDLAVLEHHALRRAGRGRVYDVGEVARLVHTRPCNWVARLVRPARRRSTGRQAGEPGVVDHELQPLDRVWGAGRTPPRARAATRRPPCRCPRARRCRHDRGGLTRQPLRLQPRELELVGERRRSPRGAGASSVGPQPARGRRRPSCRRRLVERIEDDLLRHEGPGRRPPSDGAAWARSVLSWSATRSRAELRHVDGGSAGGCRLPNSRTMRSTASPRGVGGIALLTELHDDRHRVATRQRRPARWRRAGAGGGWRRRRAPPSPPRLERCVEVHAATGGAGQRPQRQ